MQNTKLRTLLSVLEGKSRRIESDAKDMLKYGAERVRLERIVADIAELRAARDDYLAAKGTDARL